APASITLYRPVGQAELDLIAATGFRAFPDRLAHQPIFYPVLTQDYAAKIARDWNSKDAGSGAVGYVLRFAVDATFLATYEVHEVGGSQHREYWIPADDLATFNSHILGAIEIVQVFRHGEAA